MAWPNDLSEAFENLEKAVDTKLQSLKKEVEDTYAHINVLIEKRKALARDLHLGPQLFALYDALGYFVRRGESVPGDIIPKVTWVTQPGGAGITKPGFGGSNRIELEIRGKEYVLAVVERPFDSVSDDEMVTQADLTLFDGNQTKLIKIHALKHSFDDWRVLDYVSAFRPGDWVKDLLVACAAVARLHKQARLETEIEGKRRLVERLTEDYGLDEVSEGELERLKGELGAEGVS